MYGKFPSFGLYPYSHILYYDDSLKKPCQIAVLVST